MSLRTVLREATRPDHDRLDQLFGSLDLATHDGMVPFVDTNLACFRAIAPAARNASPGRLLLDQMVRCLELDRQTLGRHRPAPPLPVPEPVAPGALDPLAIDYIVAGSRLGTAVLRRRWAVSAVPSVCAARHYFGMTTDVSLWQSTCRALETIDPDSAAAAAIVGDTRRLFALFSTFCRDRMAELEPAR